MSEFTLDFTPISKIISGSLVRLKMLEGDDPVSGGRAHVCVPSLVDHVLVPWGSVGIVLSEFSGDGISLPRSWSVLWDFGTITHAHQCELEVI